MGVATKISNDCIIYEDESDVSPHYQVLVHDEDKQIRYYPPYLLASTIHELDGPKLHVQELGASYVAVLELSADCSLNDLKNYSSELKDWVASETFIGLGENSGPSYVKHSNLYVPLSTSYYWE